MEQAQDIKELSNEIINTLPFLLDPRVNQAASTIIFNNMEECLKLSNNDSDMQIVGNAFQMCVTYAKEYKIDGLMKVCARWNNVAVKKMESFKNQVSQEPVSIVDMINRNLDEFEVIVNDPNEMDREKLVNIKEELNELEDGLSGSSLDSESIRAIRYRIAMLRQSLNVSLVIIADLSSVHRLLKSAKRY